MALQAQQLERLLRRDGVAVSFLASNFSLPRLLRVVERIPGARTVVRAVLMWFKVGRRAGSVDVIHVLAASWLYFFVTVYPAVVVGRLRGRRVVLNYRGGEAQHFFAKFGWAVRPAFRLATVVTTPSEFLAGPIRKEFAVTVSIVPNLLDSSLFRFRARPAVMPRLLVTRHLEDIYDVESVLRAFRRVHQSRPDASLWIVGTGTEQARLRALARDWNLANVQFLGEVEHDRLPGVYDRCDIYVNASKVDNFPGALVEASAAGLVVVTTAAGGIPFMYEDGCTALLVPPGDWERLAAAVNRVLDEPSLASDLIRTGVAVARRCAWPEVRAALFRSYGIAREHPAVNKLDGAGCAAG
jgi:phenylacetate-CoA ligase